MFFFNVAGNELLGIIRSFQLKRVTHESSKKRQKVIRWHRIIKNKHISTQRHTYMDTYIHKGIGYFSALSFTKREEKLKRSCCTLEINKTLSINYIYFKKIIFFNEKDLLPCLLIFWNLYIGSEKICMLLFLVCLFFCLLTFFRFLIPGNCD